MAKPSRPEPTSPSRLGELLAGKRLPSKQRGLKRWSIRIPAEVALDIAEIARSEQVSINALVAIALDDLMKTRGRRSIAELAPWFPDYLLRQGKAAAGPEDFDDTNF